MTVPQRRLTDALKRCATGNPGCETDCPYASKNDKYCQRALLLAAARMIEELSSRANEYKSRADELQSEIDEYERTGM